MRYLGTLFMVFLFSGFSFAQDSLPSLTDRAVEIMNLIQVDSEKGYHESLLLEKEAREAGEEEAELLALVNQCIYFKNEIEFEKLKASGFKLQRRAKRHKKLKYQAIGKYYLFEAYLFNGLLDKAFVQLEEGMKYAEQAIEAGETTSSIKSNFYIGYSNYYQEIKDYPKQLKYIKLSGKEIDNKPDGDRARDRYLYYSNLAQAYNEMGELDSARHFAEISNSHNNNYNFARIEFMNLLILGEAAMKSSEYDKAISYFEQAEQVKGAKNHKNILNLYENMIVAYKELNLPESAQLYTYKKDSLRLNITEKQNMFLRNLLDSLNAKAYQNYLLIFLGLLIVASGFAFVAFRKKKLLQYQEQASTEYLQQNKDDQKNTVEADEYIKLMDLLKENSPAFMPYFEKSHPGFMEKLKKINPKLSPSELEICALLKLKVPTKEIAKLKFIAPKTVQNKRYIIRKKLRIPASQDTYQWFEEV